MYLSKYCFKWGYIPSSVLNECQQCAYHLKTCNSTSHGFSLVLLTLMCQVFVLLIVFFLPFLTADLFHLNLKSPFFLVYFSLSFSLTLWSVCCFTLCVNRSSFSCLVLFVNCSPVLCSFIGLLFLACAPIGFVCLFGLLPWF